MFDQVANKTQKIPIKLLNELKSQKIIPDFSIKSSLSSNTSKSNNISTLITVIIVRCYLIIARL